MVECKGFGKVTRTPTGFNIKTGCDFPANQCDLKLRGLCPREVNQTFADISRESGDQLSPERVERYADELIPQFEEGSSRAVHMRCNGRHRP